MRVMFGLVAGLSAMLVAASVAQAAREIPGKPPKGKVHLGVYAKPAGGKPSAFSRLTGREHRISGLFLGWDQGTSWGTRLDRYLTDARNGDYALMIHLGTKKNGREIKSPKAIARGGGDAHLVRLARQLNAHKQVTYVRIMAEMNGSWTPYSAFNPNGSRRRGTHSTKWYRLAFRRAAIILRGGSIERMNYLLRRNRLPAVRSSKSNIATKGDVAIVWNPQGQGSPNVRGNQPQNYWPGYSFVDYVANDLYAQNGRAFWKGMDALYKRYSRRPYIIAEWAPWGYDDAAFTKRMFDWVKRHPRTAALVYYDGVNSNEFKLARKPQSKRAYRSAMRQARYRCSSCTMVG